jgi:serine/threonine-protein kinase
MGRIYLARVAGAGGFEREVALKVMHSHLLHEPDFVSMFLDEARLAARIRNANVVATLDVQKTRESLFLVMEFVEGLSLGDMVKQRRQPAPDGDAELGSEEDAGPSSEQLGSPRYYVPLPVDITARVIADSLAGLHAAHELTGRGGKPLSLVHRDVSPGNILVGTDGIARITDFGVARAETRLTATTGGQVKGKLPYMPPEQVTADRVDRRADIYATGVVLWEMLAGRRLFAMINQPALVQEVLTGAKIPPSEHNPAVPPEVDAVCMRALAVDREARFATAREFADALDAAIRAAGYPTASHRDVADFVCEFDTNVAHIGEARESAPSVSGVGLTAADEGLVHGSAPRGTSGVTGVGGSEPPPSATEPAGYYDSPTEPRSVSVTLPAHAVVQRQASSTSAVLSDVERQPRRAPLRTAGLALGVAVIAGALAVAALRAREGASAVTADTEPSAAATTAAPTAEPTATAAPQPETPVPTALPSSSAAASAEPDETAQPESQPPSISRPTKPWRPRPRPTATQPALSERLPSEL